MTVWGADPFEHVPCRSRPLPAQGKYRESLGYRQGIRRGSRRLSPPVTPWVARRASRAGRTQRLRLRWMPIRIATNCPPGSLLATTHGLSMRIAVRHSLLAIALLGAITCLLSVYAFSRLASSSSTQRLERSREVVIQQLEFQRTMAHALGPESPVLVPARVGMRAGYVEPGASLDSIRPPLDPFWARAVGTVVASAGEAPNVQMLSESGVTVTAGARKTAQGKIAWAVIPVQAPPWSAAWRWLAIGMGLAGLALVAASAHLALSIRRGASTLRSVLATLQRDLDAPVPRPAIRELAEVAEGVALLAAELRRAQQERERLSRELAEGQRLASLGRVAAGVAHEVRNPLAAIKLRIDLLRMESLPEHVGSELGGVADEISRVDRLVSDLLVIAGKRTGPRDQRSLRQITEQRIAAMGPWCGEHGVRIEVRGDASARVDADAVGRVVDNLLRNAVEASCKGGKVQVEIAGTESEARLAVSDRGPGVEAGRESELFEPFFTTKAEGMGLGLALSRAIASAHEGTLTYRRQDGVSCFELLIPCESPGDLGKAAA